MADGIAAMAGDLFVIVVLLVAACLVAIVAALRILRPWRVLPLHIGARIEAAFARFDRVSRYHYIASIMAALLIVVAGAWLLLGGNAARSSAPHRSFAEILHALLPHRPNAEP